MCLLADLDAEWHSADVVCGIARNTVKPPVHTEIDAADRVLPHGLHEVLERDRRPRPHGSVGIDRDSVELIRDEAERLLGFGADIPSSTLRTSCTVIGPDAVFSPSRNACITAAPKVACPDGYAGNGGVNVPRPALVCGAPSGAQNGSPSGADRLRMPTTGRHSLYTYFQCHASMPASAIATLIEANTSAALATLRAGECCWTMTLATWL